MCKLVCMHITVIFIQIYKHKLDGKPTANTICPASVYTNILRGHTQTRVVLLSFPAWNHRSGISSRLQHHIHTQGKHFRLSDEADSLCFHLISDRGDVCDLTTSCMERLKVSSSVRMRRMMRAMYT